jgi:pimeloyl-[acyl-carrier protein] methyl ester esterase
MTKLYTETTGNGPDIVLLHGWGLHSGIWQTLVAQLATAFRVTTVDLPGHGYSPVLKDYSLASLTEQILAVVPKPAAWIGWSLGGLLTLSAAIHHPTHISHAIPIASTPCFIRNQQWPGISLSLLQEFGQNLAADYNTTVSEFIRLQFLSSAHAIELKTMLKALFKRGGPSVAALTHSLKLIKETDLRPELHKIRCPTLYILGRSDALVPIAIAKQLPHWHTSSRVEIIKQAGHAPFLSHPEEVLTLLNQHLKHSNN